MGTGDPPFTDRWVLQQSWNRTSTEKCFFYYLFCFLIVLVFNMWSILTHSESSCFVLPCLFGRLKRRDTLLHQTPRFIVHTEETWLPQLRGRGKKKKSSVSITAATPMLKITGSGHHSHKELKTCRLYLDTHFPSFWSPFWVSPLRLLLQFYSALIQRNRSRAPELLQLTGQKHKAPLPHSSPPPWKSGEAEQWNVQFCLCRELKVIIIIYLLPFS